MTVAIDFILLLASACTVILVAFLFLDAIDKGGL